MGSIGRQQIFDYPTVDFDSSALDTQDFPVPLSLVLFQSPAHFWRYRVLKRAMDFSLAAVMLALSLVPGIFIAAAIVLTSKGPVFYRETRIGRGGRPFQIWKFRSMRSKTSRRTHQVSTAHLHLHARWRTHKDVEDPRVTPIGKFLRKWSLDELPQLLNVLSGDMSLVGPRPVVRDELPLYAQMLSSYLAVTPGLSGLWQVSGRSNVNFTERARLDASYVERWSLIQDVRILARTIPAVLHRVGAR